MHGSRSKTPVKQFVKQHCSDGFNSGVEQLRFELVLWVTDQYVHKLRFTGNV
jgi:hypothetical protein